MSEMRLDWDSVRTRDGVKPDAAVLDVFVTSEDIDTVYDAYCSIEKVIQRASGRISGKRYYDGPLP